MSPNLQLINKGDVSPTQDKRNAPRSAGPQFEFEPVKVDVNSSRLSGRMKKLIRNGAGLNEKYKGDHSSAVFAACIAMNKIGFSDQQIASVLTDKVNYLAETAYRHANTKDRVKAAKWVTEQSLLKAKKVTRMKAISTDNRDSANGNPGTTLERKLQLTFESFEDITFSLSTSALIEDFIDNESVALLVADTNTGKTFVALDMAFHIAQGKPWFGRKVEQGAVLYVAAEGGGGIKKRIVAYRQENNLDDEPIPFRLAQGTIDLRDSTIHTPELIQEIKETEKLFGVPVRLVVIDTLNRALSGGDENSSADMGAFVKSVDDIRQRTRATVMVVHHTGKDKTKGARGHSLLKGAVDTELTLIAKKKTPKLLIVKVTKQRDYEYSLPIGMKLKTVELGKTDSGKAISSCVIRSAMFEAIDSQKLSPTATKAFETLKNCVAPSFMDIPTSWPEETPVATLADWRKGFKQQHYADWGRRNTSSDALKRACDELTGLKYVEIEGDYARILLEQ